MKTISDEECYKIQNNDRKRKKFTNGFCILGENRESPCQGDSGSPVIWEDRNNDNRAFLMGIISQKAFPNHIKPKIQCGPNSEFPAKCTHIFDKEIMKFRKKYLGKRQSVMACSPDDSKKRKMEKSAN